MNLGFYQLQINDVDDDDFHEWHPVLCKGSRRPA